MFGGGGGAPTPAPVEKRPKETDPAVQQAIADALRRKKAARGYRASILTRNLMNDETRNRLMTTLGS